MNLRFLDMGMAGVLEAALIAFLVGVVALLAIRLLFSRRLGWSHAHEIGWACLLAVVAGCGADLWHLFYMFIVPMQSPVSIRRVLAGIHDPDFLSTRVFAELVAAALGVLLAWWLFGGARRRRTRASGQDPE